MISMHAEQLSKRSCSHCANTAEPNLLIDLEHDTGPKGVFDSSFPEFQILWGQERSR